MHGTLLGGKRRSESLPEFNLHTGEYGTNCSNFAPARTCTKHTLGTFDERGCTAHASRAISMLRDGAECVALVRQIKPIDLSIAVRRSPWFLQAIAIKEHKSKLENFSMQKRKIL